ncbi:hypothetical protein M758_UG228800 [Ceratodon purpureus]|nr:hypothetical protein M758_UG228800 [Ceratodon purpureus]
MFEQSIYFSQLREPPPEWFSRGKNVCLEATLLSCLRLVIVLRLLSRSRVGLRVLGVLRVNRSLKRSHYREGGVKKNIAVSNHINLFAGFETMFCELLTAAGCDFNCLELLIVLNFSSVSLRAYWCDPFNAPAMISLRKSHYENCCNNLA